MKASDILCPVRMHAITYPLISDATANRSPLESLAGCGLPFCYTDDDREYLEASEDFEIIPSGWQRPTDSKTTERTKA